MHILCNSQNGCQLSLLHFCMLQTAFLHHDDLATLVSGIHHSKGNDCVIPKSSAQASTPHEQARGEGHNVPVLPSIGQSQATMALETCLGSSKSLPISKGFFTYPNRSLHRSLPFAPPFARLGSLIWKNMVKKFLSWPENHLTGKTSHTSNEPRDVFLHLEPTSDFAGTLT